MVDGPDGQLDEALGAVDGPVLEDELHEDALGREAEAAWPVEGALILEPFSFSMVILSEHLYPSEQVYASSIKQATHPALDDGLDGQ